MGRDKRQAKGRLDKFYKLAKEQGFRARSAFKLIQLNKKYNFLYKSRVLLDLCAAPGGWLQVAAKYMPVSSVIIVGVDLVPIKPIPNVTTIVGDITTDKCRQDLKKELKTWKADVVLHDGSPNMGKAWLQDAYTQVELTLRALKLATEMLMQGGTFITKVFRSKDYNALLWVFNQLFTRVEVTKPSSSRNVSAEIYVSCFGFLAPKTIDPKMLDPKHVFGDIVEAPRLIDIQHPEKRRRAREGYEDGNYTLFKRSPASAFVEAKDPIVVLSTVSQLVFAGDELSERMGTLPITTTDIRSFCEDLKVLGKGDFKQLLKWRAAIAKMLEREKAEGEDGSDADGAEQEEEEEDPAAVAEREEQAIDQELETIQLEAKRSERRERRKDGERRAKLRERLRLKMVLPNDAGPEAQDDALFTLRSIRSGRGLKRVADDGELVLSDSEDEESAPAAAAGEDAEEDLLDEGAERKRRLAAMEKELDRMYDEYLTRKDPKGGRKRRRLSAKNGKKQDDDDEAEADEADDDETVVDGDDGDGDDANGNPLLADGDAPATSAAQKARADQWFSQPLFAAFLQAPAADTSDQAREAKSGAEAFDADDDEDDEIRQMMASAAKKRSKGAKAAAAAEEENEADDGLDRVDGEVLDSSDDWSDDSSDDDDDDDDDDNDDDDDEVDDEGFTEVPEDDDEDSGSKRRETRQLTPAQLALASILVNKGKEALLDEAYNRYVTEDTDVPAWLADDERKNFAPNQNNPITRSEADAIKQRARALDAMPIKKVVEARARNKKKMQRQMQRLKKKADLIVDDNDISEKQKAMQIQQLFKKLKTKKEEIKYVVARGANKGKRTRPSGVQGRYKMVDSRLRKDKRGQEKVAKRQKGGASKK